MTTFTVIAYLKNVNCSERYNIDGHDSDLLIEAYDNIEGALTRVFDIDESYEITILFNGSQKYECEDVHHIEAADLWDKRYSERQSIRNIEAAKTKHLADLLSAKVAAEKTAAVEAALKKAELAQLAALKAKYGDV